MKIIGREKEQKLLKECCRSGKPELVAVYGRRRVGKTYLVKQFFQEQFDFYTTGIYNGSLKEQLAFFNKQLNRFSNSFYPVPKNWMEAFDQLQHYLSRVEKENIIVFIDEMPWLDVPRSKFLKAFELFWNSWASSQANLKLVVCGSATTWMTDKLLGGKGGLHNRVTRRIWLAPFTLSETKQLLEYQSIRWNDRQVLDCYMVFGGIPYYISMLQKSLSQTQNVDELLFSQTASLKSEYDFMFGSLFNDAPVYKRIVELLSQKAKGMTRKEILDLLGLTDNGNLTEMLKNLCNCDIVRCYSAFGKKQRDMLYQLTDLFTLFYLRFVKDYNGRDEHHWSNMMESASVTAWKGYAFEQVGFLHLNQIKKALGINGIQSDVCSWTYRDELGKVRAQIDMLIDRNDQTINLCEMKYSATAYSIKKDYDQWLLDRRELFREQTRTKKALHLTMITTLGLKDNPYSGDINSEVTLVDLMQL